MKMEFLYVLYVTAVVVGLLVLKRKKEKPTPSLEYEKAMYIFTETIQKGIATKLADYKTRNIGFPTDYEAEVIEMTHAIMGELSNYVLEQLEFYHTRKYLVTFVTSAVNTFLLGYIEQNRPTFGGQ